MKAEPQSHSENSWFSRHPFIVLAIILVAALGPFADKAIQTDDALFVRTGQWIQGHPLDFYGGKVNWWSSDVPMWMANQNPPLLPYFFAAAASIFGWNEITQHFVQMGFAFAAAAGIFRLAKMWCGRPLLATVIAIFTPAFLVSSNTLMCDVPMLAFWVWSLAVFMRALEAETPWGFALAGLLAGLAILTKYSAAMLLPLIAVIGVVRKRKAGWWLLAVVVPVVIAMLYEELTAQAYGHGLISAASRYAHSGRFGFPGGATAKAIIALTFAGGSLLPVFFLGPWLWRWRTGVIGGTVIFGGLIGIFTVWNPGLIHPWADPAAWQNAGFRLEVALLATAGAQLILIAAADPWQRRDTDSLALFLWIIGVFVFAGIINWTTNARSFLPACPAAAILAVRRLETIEGSFKLPVSLAFPISLAALAALSLVFADFQTANEMRSYAEQIAAKYSQKGRQLWIEGHGGFQYYLEQLGGKSVDVEDTVLAPGDIMAVTWSSGNTVIVPPGAIGAVEVLLSDPKCWVNLSGKNRYGLAGFYGADNGPVPFVPGEWKQSFFIAKVLQDVQYHGRPANPEEVAQNGAMPDFRSADFFVKTEPILPGNPVAIKQIQSAARFYQQGQTNDAIRCYRKALEADPNNTDALNNLAWILTTANDPSLRNGSEAVQLGAKAVDLTQGRQPTVIGTLAAAYAEDGEFSKAVGIAQAARFLALLTGRNDVAASNAKNMNLYLSGKTITSQ